MKRVVIVVALVAASFPVAARAAACDVGSPPSSAPATWQPLLEDGPTDAFDVAFDAAGAGGGRVLVASGRRGPNDGGAYVSADGGGQWTQGAGILPDARATAVAFAPGDPDVLYAGTAPTHDAEHPGEEERHVAFFRSADGGASWCATAPWEVTTTALLTDARQPDKVWAGLADGTVARSDDYGVTWTASGSGLPRSPVGVLLAGPQPGLLLAGTPSGPFRSEDGGRTWAPSREGMPTAAGFGDGLRDLAQDPRDAAVVYAAGTFVAYRSSDFGATWQPMPKPVTQPHDHAWACHSFGLSFASLAVTGDGTLVGGETCGLWTSRDGGQTWSFADVPGPSVSVRRVRAHGAAVWALSAGEGIYVSRDNAFTFGLAAPGWPGSGRCLLAPLGERRVLGQCDAAPLRSDDGGATWQPVADLVEAEISAVARDATAAGLVVAATRWSGVFTSRDGGVSWRRAAAPVSGTAVANDPARSGTFYLAASAPPAFGAMTATGVWRTTDGGMTWAPVGTVPSPLVDTLAVSPADPRVLLAGSTLGLWRSTDGGRTWSADAGVGANGIMRLAFVPGTDAVLAAGARVFRSADGGATFSEVPAPYPFRPMQFALQPGLRGVVFANAAAGLLRSDDAGETWVDVDLSGVADERVDNRALYADPDEPNGLFLVAGPNWTSLYRTKVE